MNRFHYNQLKRQEKSILIRYMEKFSLETNCLLSIGQFFLILSLGEKAGELMTGGILTIKEVAEYLKLAEKTAYRLAADGKLPGFKVGGSWRFKQEDIERWINERKKESGIK